MLRNETERCLSRSSRDLKNFYVYTSCDVMQGVLRTRLALMTIYVILIRLSESHKFIKLPGIGKDTHTYLQDQIQIPSKREI